MTSVREKLTYANVMSTIAVVIAVAGGSTAVAISAKKAPKNSVTSASIRDGSVTANDLAKVKITSVPFTKSVNCAPGEKLLGGGGFAFDASGQETTTGLNRLQRSYPVDNGWVTQGLDNSKAFALCLSARPGK